MSPRYYPPKLITSARREINPIAIRWARLVQRMTQEELAINLGIEARTLRRWELGRSKPNKQNYKLLMDFIEYTQQEVKRGELRVPMAAKVLTQSREEIRRELHDAERKRQKRELSR